MQQKQQVQDRKPSFSGAVVREPAHSPAATPPSLPTPPITPPDRRVEDKTPSRTEASVESSPAPQPPASRGQCCFPRRATWVGLHPSAKPLTRVWVSPAGEGFSATALTMSARISALNIVGELLRKVGVSRCSFHHCCFFTPSMNQVFDCVLVSR